jgi:TolB protein
MASSASRSSTARRWPAWTLVALLLSPAAAAAQDAAADGDGDIADIVVDSQTRILYPIALPDLLAKGEGKATREAAATAIDALRTDLAISGYFNQIPPKSFLHDWRSEGLAVASIKFKDWFNVGAQALVKGAASGKGGKVLLDLRLFKVDSGKRIKLNWEAKEVGRKQVRAEVHRFANEVVRHFTGEPGIFGSRMAYVRKVGNGNKAVFVMDHDGHRRRRISTTDTLNLLPGFSRNGGSIVYTSYAKGNPDLYLHRLGSKQAVALAAYKGMNVGGAFSPSGKTIAVTLSRDGNSEIYLLSASDGAIQKRLTNNWAIDSSPTWSPDGKRLAFVSDRSGTPQIYVMSASGGEAKRLTFQGTYNTTPEWSPKAGLIAFTARDERYKFDIFTVDAGSGQIKRLTQNQGNNEEPTWAPDGRYLAFTSTRTRGQKIWVMTADGQHQTCVTPDGSGYSTPSWGPAP